MALTEILLKHLVEHPEQINFTVLPKDLVAKLVEALRTQGRNWVHL